LSSVIDNIRSFQTTKGFTLITGDSIKTGSIKNNDESVIVDLDNGTIKGTLKFASGVDVKTSVDAAQQSADEAYAYAQDIQIGGRNLFRNGSFELDGISILYQNTVSFIEIRSDLYGEAFPKFGSKLLAIRYLPGDSYGYIGPIINIEPNSKYKLSFWHFDGGIPGDSSSYYKVGDRYVYMPVTFAYGWHKEEFDVTTGPGETTFFFRMGRNGNDPAWTAIDGIKLEIGNKATDYTPAPEDVEESTSYLRTALQNNTTIQGGLLATSLIRLGAVNQNGTWVEKAGINGIAGDDNTPRLWSGGTLEQAIARIAGDIANGAKMVVTEGGKIFGREVELYGTLATSPTGERIVLDQASKSIIIYDANNAPKTVISSGAIPSLATLLATNSAQVDASKSANAHAVGSSITDTQYTADLILPSTSSNYTITTPPIVCHCAASLETEPPYRASCYVIVRLIMPDNSEIELGSISANTSGIRSASLTIPSRQFSGMPAGTYKIKLIANAFATAYADATASAQIASPNHIFSAESVVNVSRIYKDGMFLITDASHYHYISPNREVVKNDEIKGFGVLAAAHVDSSGNVNNRFNNILSAGGYSAGLYTINHSIGNLNYSVFVTPINSAGNYTATIYSFDTGSVVIRMTNSGNPTTCAFFIQIVAKE
jgi:hypothetical protein